MRRRDITVVAALAAALFTTPAAGADVMRKVCLSKDAARALYGGSAHLYWHGSDHCWDNRRPGSPAPKLRIEVVPQNDEAAPAPSGPMVLYPDVMRVAPGAIADELLAPFPMTQWPPLLDEEQRPFTPWADRVGDQFR